MTSGGEGLADRAGYLGTRVNQYLLTKDSLGKGVGTFAAKRIAAGTCVLSDDPVCVIKKDPSRINDEDVEGAYLKMKPTHRKRLDSLHESHRPFPTKQMRIWMANAFGYEDQDMDVASIFLDLSRFNHSCVPNTQWDWNEKTRKADVHALVPIRTGTELTICYDDLCSVITSAYRKATLRYKYGFTCTCEACEPNSDFHLLSEMRRHIIGDIHYSFLGCERPDFERRAVDFSSRNSNKSMHIFTKPLRGHRYPHVQEVPFRWFLLAKLLEAEGLVGLPAGEAYKHAAAGLLDMLVAEKEGKLRLEISSVDVENMNLWSAAHMKHLCLYSKAEADRIAQASKRQGAALAQ